MPPEDTIETYQRKAKLRLNKLKTRIITLEKQNEVAEADIKVRNDQKLNQIRGQYAQTKERLNELGASTQEAWPEFRSMLDKAIDALEEAINFMSRRIPAQSKDL